METTPNDVDEQERQIREGLAGGGGAEEAQPEGDTNEGDDKGHTEDEGAELQEGDTDAP